ncbi:MAG: flagellin [bacterium]
MASNTVINTNVMALTSHRNLATVGNRQAQANARLSSGKRINTAADDAAGLAISEKMKSQIVGLDMASKNSEDATSLIQTAEGALAEVNNMLTRIRELTVQSANDTNQDSDRVKLAEEVAALMTEIDSISERTEFNGMKLNDGSFQGYFQIGANAGQSLELGIGSMTVDGIGATDIKSAFGITEQVLNDNQLVQSTSAGIRYISSDPLEMKISFDDLIEEDQTGTATQGGFNYSFTFKDQTGNSQTVSTFVDLTGSDGSGTDIASRVAAALGRDEYGQEMFSVSSSGAELTITMTSGLCSSLGTLPESGNNISFVPAIKGFVEDDGDEVEITDNDYEAPEYTDDTEILTVSGALVDNAHAGIIVVDPSKMKDGETVLVNGTTFTYNSSTPAGENLNNTFSDAAGLYTCMGSAGFTGMNADSNGMIKNTDGDSVSYLTGSGTYTSDSSLISSDGFDYSQTLNTIDFALSNVTSQRAALGAVQNRLEYTKNGLDISSENLQAANSRIEDADMAEEMMNLTSANVLQQAATSMLAQANQAPQSITQLLG